MIWFLAPYAIAMAAEYCLPAVTVYLQQYAGGAVAAAFLTGMVGGYNGSVLETSALGSADAGCFAAEKIGACIGTALQYGSPKGLIKGGVTATTNLVGREVVHSATNVATQKVKQAWSWFSRNLVRRNAPQTGQSLAKNTAKETIKHSYPTSFVGSRRFPLDYAPYQTSRNVSSLINGRKYSGHALDRMQDRGLMPSVIENTIKNGNKSIWKTSEVIKYYDPINNVTVIKNNQSGQVIITFFGSH